MISGQGKSSDAKVKVIRDMHSHRWEANVQLQTISKLTLRRGLPAPRCGRFTPEKTPVPTVQEVGWASGFGQDGMENLAPQGLYNRTLQDVASRYID
jgi:hypothetical protein